ncbi:hypothetical protein A4X13_0g590 [Tilletia indica]|uniref:Large ribosomal subunit protein uL30m n=1 Tax=Tilletia indica TaxID=43049 RepID=A0A177THY5_9BASI|nr:hypothetical protein A4X13_0g590 [Tilletia indica]
MDVVVIMCERADKIQKEARLHFFHLNYNHHHHHHHISNRRTDSSQVISTLPFRFYCPRSFRSSPQLQEMFPSASSQLSRKTIGRLTATPSLLYKSFQCECARAQSYSTASTSTLTQDSNAPAAEAATSFSDGTTHYRITLRRSAIGLPEHRSLVLESLGLKKRLSSVYMRQDPTAAGKILKVKELVAVQNVRRASTAEAQWVRENWSDRMRTGLHVNALAAGGGGAAADASSLDGTSSTRSSAAIEDEVWIDENGFVVDAGRTGKQAPRGYRVIGNVLDGSADQVTL